MPIFRSDPFEEDIEKATSENNLTDDWSQILLICDKASNFQDGAKHCLKAIIKRLYHPVPRVVLQTLTLLDACVKNCDRKFLLQVASSEFTNEVRKLLPKMHPSASDKLKVILQKWSLEEFKDDPELCIIPSLYYKLKSEGYEFPSVEKEKKKTVTFCTNPDGVSSQEEENDIIKAIEISLKDTGRYEVPEEYKNVVPTTKSAPEPFKVRALYDFDAAEDNELTIKAGELVLVSDNSNSSWWKGSNHRGEGLFPSSFVTEDLEYAPEEQTKPTASSAPEVAPEIPEELEIKLDEAKIEKLINWLNDIDPAEEIIDPDELLLLERQCYGMTPLIEENLQEIDTRIAKLNLVNEKIMSAFDLFHSLSDHTAYSGPMQYYPGTLNQHVVQFPHPHVTGPVPPGMIMHPPPVPQNIPMSTASQNTQINSVPSSTVQSAVPPQMPSNSNPNPVLTSTVTEGSQAAISTSGPTPVPFNQVNSLGYIGGYPVPTQAIPYPMQYGPNMMQPGYMQSSVSVAGPMSLPYSLPPMRPYFPVQYYYVNSSPLPQQISTATTTITTASLDTNQVNVQKHFATAGISAPIVPNYSTDVKNISADSHAKLDNAGVNEAMDGKNASNEIKDELLEKKNL